MMNCCSKCNTHKELSEFKKCSKNKNGLRSWCKECDRANDLLRSNSPQRRLVKKREKLKSRYGITEAQQFELAKKQNFMCAIYGCNSILAMDKNTHTDHCHKSGKVRGLLCASCNKALGLIKDNSTVAAGMVRYLQESSNA